MKVSTLQNALQSPLLYARLAFIHTQTHCIFNFLILLCDCWLPVLIQYRCGGFFIDHYWLWLLFLISGLVLSHLGPAGKENMPLQLITGEVSLHQMEGFAMVELSWWKKFAVEWVTITFVLYICFSKCYQIYFFKYLSPSFRLFILKVSECRELIQVLGQRFGHSSLECKYAQHLL